MKRDYTCSNEDQLDALAADLLGFLSGQRVWAFFGAMGAGKTTLIKALCRQLGVTENVSSPTFSLVNEYKDRHGKSVYHFDFYRIESVREAYDLGYEEYFFSGDYCFVEWPEKILNLLPQEAASVTIRNDGGIRFISASYE